MYRYRGDCILERINPFRKIYDICDSGDSKDKYEHLPDFPRYIDIELTNYCNYKCLMCPVGTGTMKRVQGFMSKEVYDKLLNEIKDYKTSLRFIRWEDFIEYIKKAKNLGIMCHLNTNGSLLTEDDLKSLVEIGLDSIKFSFQGIDEKSYSEMRNKNCFNDLINKIKRLYEIRGNNIYPYIHIATTVTYENKENVYKFKKYTSQFADLVTIGRTKLEHIDIEKSKLSKEEKEMFKYLKEQESLVKQHFKCCPEVFDKLSINWDGTVTACCGDYDNKMLIGDLKENSLKEIWNSEKADYYRKLLSQKKYDEIGLCRYCYDYMELQTSGIQNI